MPQYIPKTKLGVTPGVGLGEGRAAAWDNHESLRLSHEALSSAYAGHNHEISAVPGLADMLTAFHQRIPVATGYREGSETSQVAHWYKTDPFLSYNDRVINVIRVSTGVYRFILRTVDAQLNTTPGDITELAFFFSPTDNNLVQTSKIEDGRTDAWRLNYNVIQDASFSYVVMMR